MIHIIVKNQKNHIMIVIGIGDNVDMETTGNIVNGVEHIIDVQMDLVNIVTIV